MPKIGRDEITTTQDRRIFLQLGGPSPANAVKYAGVQTQYLMIDGVTRPVRGAIEPIRVPSINRRRQYDNVGRKAAAPAFPTATLHVLESRGQLPFSLGGMDCPMNLYLPVGKCERPDSFLLGWSDFVEIISYAEATDVDEGARSAWDDDNQAEDSIALVLESKYAIGKLGFGAEAANEVSREVIDIVYGSEVQCGDCGPTDDGTKRIYAVAKSSGAASPGYPAEVIYTVDGGATWAQVNIDGFGATEDPLAIDIVDDKLVVLGDDAYFWATLNRKTGVPGAFTKVSTGFVAANTPRDLYVLSPSEIFFCGDGGYVYKSTDVTAGVSVISAGDATTDNLLRIHGDGGATIVAAGAGSAVIVSSNRGATWGTTVAEPSAIALDIYALWVVDDERWFVGTAASGRLFWTQDGGETWDEISFTGAGAGAVRDIVFATDEVGYFVHDDNTPTGRIFATWNGGANWVRNDGGSYRLLNWPTIDRVNRVATPRGAGPQTAANNVALACLAGDGTDGTILVGAANEF